MLHEALQEFPFLHEGVHYSAALSAVLSVVCRFAIQGNVPLYAIRSTAPASGKGLLADVIAIIGTSMQAPRWPQTTDEEEERKRLLTLALAGDPLVLIDNVTRPLGSAALDAALTAQTFKDRVLGHTESKKAPMHAVFLASGNNMVFKGDTARRVVPIDLDPKMERPEERAGFAHADLKAWVRTQRPVLVCAALTVLKAYFQAGTPPQGLTPLGSFEQWSTLVRSALVWAGEADPCEGRKDLQAESDPEFEGYQALLTCWEACYPREAQTLSRVVQDISLFAQKGETKEAVSNKWNALGDALGAFDERYDGKTLNTKKIGNALRCYAGRVIGSRRLIKDGTYNRATEWRIDTL